MDGDPGRIGGTFAGVLETGIPPGAPAGAFVVHLGCYHERWSSEAPHTHETTLWDTPERTFWLRLKECEGASTIEIPAFAKRF